MPKKIETNDKISRGEIAIYIGVAIVILIILAGFGVGTQANRQALIDKYGFWNALIGYYR